MKMGVVIMMTAALTAELTASPLKKRSILPAIPNTAQANSRLCSPGVGVWSSLYLYGFLERNVPVYCRVCTAQKTAQEIHTLSRMNGSGAMSRGMICCAMLYEAP